MEYQEVKKKLEAKKLQLMNQIQSESLSIEEKENLLRAIDNYEYIIELTDMNHFERGSEEAN